MRQHLEHVHTGPRHPSGPDTRRAPTPVGPRTPVKSQPQSKFSKIFSEATVALSTTPVVSVWFQTVSVLFWRVLARAYYFCCFSVVSDCFSLVLESTCTCLLLLLFQCGFRLFQSCFGEYLHVPTTPVVSSL